MHVLVLLVDLLGVSLRGKPGKTLLEHIDTEGLVACDADINSEIKLVTVNQERVRDIFRNNTGLIDIDVVNVVNNLNTATLAPTGRLENPNIFL
jgi:hypothetical protein